MTKINFEKLTNPTLINLPTLIQNAVRAHRADNENYDPLDPYRENYDSDKPAAISPFTYVVYVLCFIAVIYLASRRYRINNWSYGIGFWLGWIFFGAMVFPAFALLMLIIIFITQGYRLTK